ncbi:hypothetical protein [Ktedonospora formicarum]
MAARRRKTLVLCRTCHKDIQHGFPVKHSYQAHEHHMTILESLVHRKGAC